MEKILHVTVRSLIENLDDFGLTESTESETVTESAAVIKEGEGLTLVYEEKNEGGACETRLTVTELGVRLVRHGAIESVMEFRVGELTKTVYSVPPFSFDAEIETKRIKSTLTECGGTLELRYTLTIGGAKKKTRLSLTVY